MDIFNPTTSAQITCRDRLLQATMRPKNPLFPIASEYPIVLDPESANYSWCLGNKDRIVAHLNLWPRTFAHSSDLPRHKIGLIGNVATDPSLQGKGLMTDLMCRIIEIAKKESYSALILWSDLPRFYQKFGFESAGNECRISLTRNALNSFYTGQYLPRDPDSLKDDDLEFLMKLRPSSGPTLARSATEFRHQLRIPHTLMFTTETLSDGYGVVGKGYDMVGVVHEWGLSDTTMSRSLCADIAEYLQLPQIMLLSPDPSLETAFSEVPNREKSVEMHPMCLALYLKDKHELKKALQTGFIWGLDSI